MIYTQLKIVGETSTALKTIDTVLSNISVTSQSAIVSNGILANSLKGYSAEAIKSAIAQSTLNETQIRAILIEKGYEGQLLETTTAELAQATATNALSASEAGATASTLGLGNAIKGLGASMKAFALSNPILTAIAAIGAAIYGAVKAYDALTISVEEANEAMDEAVSEYETAKSSLESINSELAEQTQKMDELLAKDKLTYAEEGQLEELQAITKELMLQRDIEEKDTEKASNEAARKTIDAYDKQYGNYDISKGSVENYKKIATGADIANIDDGNISYNLALLSKYKELLAGTEKELEDTSKLSGSEIELLKADQQDYIDGIGFVSDSLDTALSDLEEKRRALEDGYKRAVAKQKNGEALTSTDVDAIDRYESIYNAIKLIYEYTNQNAWNNMEISDIFNTAGIEKTKEELIEMAQSGELTVEELKKFPMLFKTVEESELLGQNAAQAFCDEINACAEAAGRMAGNFGNNDVSFTDAISEVQSLSEGLDQLDKIYADVYDKGDFDWSSILNNEDFSKTFSGFTEEYNSFIQTISNSPSDINACQESFNRLASAYLNASDVLGSQLTEETKKATIEILKQQGFVNAETLVTQVLTQRKKELALEEQFEAAAKQSETVESQNLTNATIDEINQLVSEGLITSETAEQMNLLAFKKQWVNRNTINTSADIKNLAALAGVSSKLAQLLSSLALAKQQVEGGIPAKAMEATIASLEKQIDEYVNGNFGNFENPVYGGGASTKSAKEKSSSSSNKKEDTTETLDWIETKLEAVSKQTSKLEDAFDKTFTPSSTTDKFREYLGQIQEEIAANNTAISTYQDYLNNIGLSGDWIYKIQNGLYSIEEITDDTLKEQISNYQTYYDKIVSCQETINSLEEKRLELEDNYAQKIVGYQEKETSAIEKQIEKQEKLIKLKETFGTSFAKKNLKSEQKLYKDELELLEKQNGELLALQSTVAEGTDAWDTYQDQIDSNKDSMASLIQSMADLAKSIANLPLDKLDAFLEKNDKKNELYEAKLGNAATASSKNKLINKQIKIAKSSNKETQDTAKTTAANLKTSTTAVGTARKSDNVSKTNSLYKKVKSYTSKKKLVPASLITQLGEKGYGNLVAACENYNAALTANETAQETAKLTAEETKSQVAGFVKQKFDNVQTQYENKQGLISSKANIVSSKMDLAAAKGYLDSENWYKQLIEYEQRNQQSLTEELSDLQTRLETAVSDGKIQIYSDEW